MSELQFEYVEFDVVPPGKYSAVFQGAEDWDDNGNDYGPAVRLNFLVMNGDHDGKMVTAICSKKLTRASKLTKFVSAMNGGPFRPGDIVRLDDYLGTNGSIVVEATQNGGSKVTDFVLSNGGH